MPLDWSYVNWYNNIFLLQYCLSHYFLLAFPFIQIPFHPYPPHYPILIILNLLIPIHPGSVPHGRNRDPDSSLQRHDGQPPAQGARDERYIDSPSSDRCHSGEENQRGQATSHQHAEIRPVPGRRPLGDRREENADGGPLPQKWWRDWSELEFVFLSESEPLL